jgi:hypothetical protein
MLTKKDQNILAEMYVKSVLFKEKVELQQQGKSPSNADQYMVYINGKDVARVAVYNGTVTVSVLGDANKVLGTSFRYPVPNDQQILASLDKKQFKSLDQFKQEVEKLSSGAVASPQQKPLLGKAFQQ